MTSLHERLVGDSAPACKLCAFLGRLSQAEVNEWQYELGLPVHVVGNTAVVNELSRNGLDITEVSVRRHRARHAAQN